MGAARGAVRQEEAGSRLATLLDHLSQLDRVDELLRRAELVAFEPDRVEARFDGEFGIDRNRDARRRRERRLLA